MACRQHANGCAPPVPARAAFLSAHSVLLLLHPLPPPLAATSTAAASLSAHHALLLLPLPLPPPPPGSYINGKPFVVREAERPFSNLEYTGIDRERVEGMEARLKQDVLQEVRWRGVCLCGMWCWEACV